MIGSKSALPFFLLVFALSIPVWVIGEFTEFQLLPGLPVAALGFVCPALAALILVPRERGTDGARRLLWRAFDWGRVQAKVWYAPTLLLMPGLTFLSLVVVRSMGTPVPPLRIAPLPALGLCIAFFISALGEELGWSGYAIDVLSNRWSALKASTLLGFVWATWHLVPLMQAHRSASWIAGWFLGSVSFRVLIVWLYNNTGRSIFAASLFHMTFNVSWQLFPVHGSYFDPRIAGVITSFAAVVVAFTWGPRSLSRPTKCH